MRFTIAYLYLPAYRSRFSLHFLPDSNRESRKFLVENFLTNTPQKTHSFNRKCFLIESFYSSAEVTEVQLLNASNGASLSLLCRWKNQWRRSARNCMSRLASIISWRRKVLIKNPLHQQSRLICLDSASTISISRCTMAHIQLAGCITALHQQDDSSIWSGRWQPYGISYGIIIPQGWSGCSVHLWRSSGESLEHVERSLANGFYPKRARQTHTTVTNHKGSSLRRPLFLQRIFRWWFFRKE